MKKVIAILMALGAITMSCTEGSMDIGLDLSGAINQGTVMVDTLRLDTYTVKEDSTITSLSNELQVGAYRMNNMLNISSEAYFQVTLPSINYGAYNITQSIVLDSAKLELRLSDYIGDTTDYQTITLHEMLTELPTNDDQSSSFYYPYQENSIAEKTWKLRPNKDSLIELSLNQDLAARLWEYYKISYRTDNPNLLKVLKGLVLKGGANNKAIAIFNSANSNIRLYTHLENTYTQYSFSFPLSINKAQFNHYTHSSIYEGINNLTTAGQQIKATETGNEFVLNNALGLSGKVIIPGIANLKEISDLTGIHKVEMILFSTRKNLKQIPIPPSSLGLFVINRNNEIESALTDLYGTQVSGVYSYHPEDLVFNSYYSFDLTAYFKNILFSSSENKGFKIIPTDDGTANGSFGGVNLGNYDNSSFKAILRVYYGK